MGRLDAYTSFTYDALNRVTNVAYSTDAASVFEYDGGVSGTPNDIGHLTKMIDESGQTTFSYDAMGRLQSKTQVTNAANGASASLVMSYTYGTEAGASGKLTSVTYPSGNRVNYIYDANGGVRSLTINPSDLAGGTSSSTVPLLSDIQYTPFGSAISWNWGNNGAGQANVYTRTFDINGRMTSYPLGNPSGTGLIRTVAYDAASRVVSIPCWCGNAVEPRSEFWL